MRCFNLVLKLFFFFFISFIVINLGLYIYAYLTPKIPLKTANQISIYDKNDDLVFENIDGSKWVKLNQISDYLIEATIYTEDKNFYSHQGFDYLRILKASLLNIKKGNLSQGASTISQQYIKNLYLNFNKTWKRKIEEAYLTLELETHYTKDEILEGYLNTINYGGGNYGIENASKYYFNKSAKDLSIEEATLISGIPKSPTKYNPINNLKNAKKRQQVVLNSLVENKLITQDEANRIYDAEVVLYGKKTEEDLTSINYYIDAVMAELKSIDSIPKSLIDTGGLKISTNLDLNAQEILEKNVKEETSTSENIQVASMVVESKTGKISALIGGKDYSLSSFNRVTQAKRQVGSTMKPFLYYKALENGFTSSSVFSSEKTTFNVGKDKTYSPQNYGEKYANKEISLAAAIAYSDNIYAVKTHLFLGEEELVNIAKNVGVSTPLQSVPSLPLGTNEISMMDYSNGYATLANYGVKTGTYLINKVTDMDGKVLYTHKSQEESVLNKKYCYILNQLLTNTYNYSFVDYTSPTMISINNILTKKFAVKSGSTNTDYWTIGYNPDYLVMVWNGHDDNSNVEVKDSKISKNIWAKTIENLTANLEETWYEIPDDVVANLVNPVTGKLEENSKNVPLYYIKGTEPEVNQEIIEKFFLSKKNNN